MALKTRGVPHPLGSDPNDAQAWIEQLATWTNDRPGVAALSTTARNALTGTDRWDGKLVLDTTLDRLFRWDAGTTTWIQIADSSEVAALLATTGVPLVDGTASRGVSSSAARADHVHPEQPGAPKIASGQFASNVVLGLNTITIPLPASRFTTTPRCSVAVVVDDPARVTGFPVLQGSTSSTQIVFRVRFDGAYAGMPFDWIAVQTT